MVFVCFFLWKRIHLILKENNVSIDLEIAKGVMPKAYIVCVLPSVRRRPSNHLGVGVALLCRTADDW